MRRGLVFQMAVSMAAAGVAFVGGAASAGTATLEPVKDNTLIQNDEGAFSNGAGQRLFAGRTNEATDSIRRAVLAFDVASAVPAGATITSAELTLFAQTPPPTGGTQAHTLHRLLADWGEGTSAAFGGLGAASTAGDATWIHTFFPGSFWSAAGGDFDAAASATRLVGDQGSYTWGSTDQMVEDVQGWLDDPSSNFGWLIAGNESTGWTARKFTSREGSASQRPTLVIEFDEATPCDADTDGNGTVDVDDLVAVILAWGTDGQKSGTDINGDGVVDVDDLLAVILAWGPC